jgi:hypothetical protein
VGREQWDERLTADRLQAEVAFDLPRTFVEEEVFTAAWRPWAETGGDFGRVIVRVGESAGVVLG